jgi:hypothetical protein
MARRPRFLAPAERLRSFFARERVARFVLPVLMLGVAAGLFLVSAMDTKCGLHRGLMAAPEWFDPAFFQYNLLLGLTAILIVPLVTLTYARTMAGRKQARIRREIPDDHEWEIMEPRLQERTGFRYYLGSCALATTVVVLGVSIVLMFKPVALPGHCGVDIGRGVNILVGGPYMASDAQPGSPEFKDFYSHVIASLVGFQFGFVGAYVYFITGLARSFFTFDLTPNTLVDGTVRMATASILALVCSYLLQELGLANLAPASFLIGFFPDRGFALLESSVTRLVPLLGGDPPRTIPLTVLGGMSYFHRVRLEREGFDNVENLRHALPGDLAVRTGFGYRQLAQWIGDAWLAAHLRDDYRTFVDAVGIASHDELARYFAGTAKPGLVDELVPAYLEDSKREALRHKLRVLQQLMSREG